MSLYDLLKAIVAKPQFHARWLNTISYLEHLGSRKLMKSLDSQKLDLELLQHIAEEARHAYFFKKMLESQFPGVCPTFDRQYLLAGEKAHRYFQNLDHFVDQQHDPDSKHLVYRYVTLAIEIRALDVYQIYQRILKEKLYQN